MKILSFKDIGTHYKFEFLGIKLKVKKFSRVRSSEINIKYNFGVQELMITCGRGWESRNLSTVKMFLDAFKTIRNDINKSFELIINTYDMLDENKYKGKVFAYAKYPHQKNVILIPDFCFDCWTHTGVNDYEETANKIIQAGEVPYEIPKLFWIGNVATSKNRELLVEKFKNNPNYEFLSMSWNINQDLVYKSNRYISLPNQCKYKYLLDIEGQSYSSRVKLLLFSKRPLFLVERQSVEYFFEDLKPFVHYIPVKNDLSDLDEMFEWAENNYDKALEIAKNAQKYAIENLSRKAATEYFAKEILKYVNQ